MVITVEVKHVYKYPLEAVAKAHFTKYPSEKEKFIQRVDTVESHFRRGVSYSRRIAVCHNVIPVLLRKIQILNEKNFLLEESSWLDHTKRVLTLTSHNITWAKYARLKEQSIFTPCANNSNWTQLEQQGTVEITGIGKLGRVVELFAEKILHAGVRRGIGIMEEVLKEKYGPGPGCPHIT